ncbi:MAG: hypothetical protein AB9M53_07335 [Leptothrix sp. (in: b-proteobacteria)]
MMPSPIQLLELSFKRIKVEVDEEHAPTEPAAHSAPAFGFDGVNITTEFGIGELDASSPVPAGRTYFVSLRVLIDNAPASGPEPQKFSPYLIDVEAGGVVHVPPPPNDKATPQDLAVVNGAALLWSSIREQVLSLTSRMPPRQAMLPTVHFLDLKDSLTTIVADPPIGSATDEPAKRSARPSRKRATP